MIVPRLDCYYADSQYYLSQQLIIRPAADDAASNHAQLNWIGIALSPNVPNLRIGDDNTVNNSVVYYNIPHKKSYYSGIALNWPNYDSNRECFHILREEQSKADPSSKVKYDIHSDFIAMWPIFHCHSLRRMQCRNHTNFVLLKYIPR